jgi:hypothetical protein
MLKFPKWPNDDRRAAVRSLGFVELDDDLDIVICPIRPQRNFMKGPREHMSSGARFWRAAAKLVEAKLHSSLKRLPMMGHAAMFAGGAEERRGG